MTTLNNETSGLAFIELKTDNPYDLFKDWYKDACTYCAGMPNALCLATVSKDLKVSARNVVLRRLDDDGFVIYTDSRSRKTKELTEVPRAAMCFLWMYKNEENQDMSRQVRIEGDMVVLDKDDLASLYEKDKLFCKIRSHICHQDKEIDWNELKERHDQLYNEVRQNKKVLPMPEHVIGYKMLPTSIEFYFARDALIGDRILFEKDKSSTWTHKRISA